jgi:putative Mg2+ transporter-C (MgtC) family protein
MDFLSIDLAQIAILGKAGLAMLLGAFIGLDREFADKPAGLRTHMLVTGAASLVVSLSEIIVTSFNDILVSELIRSDPIRIMEAVITGVSFLGAGTILRHRAGEGIEGLTTAASILFAAAIGVGVALSQYWLAIGTTLLVLFTLRAIGWLGTWLDRKRSQP